MKKDISKESQELISTFLQALVPTGLEARRRLAAKTKLHKDTFARLKERNSLSADTLFRLCLGHGIAPRALKSALKGKGNTISQGTVDWIKFGAELDDREIEIFLRLLEGFKKHYVLKTKRASQKAKK